MGSGLHSTGERLHGRPGIGLRLAAQNVSRKPSGISVTSARSAHSSATPSVGWRRRRWPAIPSPVSRTSRPAINRTPFPSNADLGRGDDVVRLAREAEARSGGVDVLVNNASNYLRAPFDELTEAIWDASLDVNLKAPFLLAWHLGRAMKARGRGRIVNLADWAGERPYADYLPYCVSKAGVICLTKALAKALPPAVQVNAVAPGPVLPPADLTPVEREAIR